MARQVLQQDKRALMLTQTPGKLMMSLSLPAIVGMAVIGLYTFMDAVYAGQLIGMEAMGAVAVAYPFTFINSGGASMIGMGSASVLSRAIGAKDQRTIDQVMGELRAKLEHGHARQRRAGAGHGHHGRRRRPQHGAGPSVHPGPARPRARHPGGGLRHGDHADDPSGRHAVVVRQAREDGAYRPRGRFARDTPRSAEGGRVASRRSPSSLCGA